MSVKIDSNTKRTISRYTCDSCGAQKEIKSRRSTPLPDQWLEALDDEGEILHHHCQSCRAKPPLMIHSSPHT